MAEPAIKVGKIIIIDELPAIIVNINEDGTVNAQQFLDGHGVNYVSNYKIGG